MEEERKAKDLKKEVTKKSLKAGAIAGGILGGGAALGYGLYKRHKNKKLKNQLTNK